MRYKNESATKANGVVYTPTDMAKYTAKQILKYGNIPEDGNVSVLDPAVGGGELLVSLIQELLPCAKAIHAVGYETDPIAGKQTQDMLSSMFPSVTFEIRIEDFLVAAEEGRAGKYDFIIANPPYVRTQIMGSEKAQGIADKLTLAGRVDIYYAFLIYAEQVLKESGTAGFITSNKFMTIKAGTSVRNYMVSHYSIHHITDLGDTKLFNASVLPCIVVFSLGKTDNASNVRFTSVYQSKETNIKTESIQTVFDGIESDGYVELPDKKLFWIQQGHLHSAEEDSLWTLSSNANQEWLRRVESNTMMYFSQIGKIRVGIKTTADNVFIGDDWSGEKAAIELLKPLITHRNAGQIIPSSDSMWQVLYTHTVVNGKKTAFSLDDYPVSKAYLEKYYDQLSAREYLKKANREWYEIWVPQNPEAWSHKKIVFRDISEEPQFWYDDTGAVVNGDCYWIDIFPDTLEPIIYLALAVANSSFIEKYYDVKFNTKLYSGKRRYQSQYVEEFPVPFYDSPEAQEAIALVAQIIESHDSCLVGNNKDRLNYLVEQMFS